MIEVEMDGVHVCVVLEHEYVMCMCVLVFDEMMDEALLLHRGLISGYNRF